MLKVFLTNLSKYNEGKLVGKWFDLENYVDFDEFKESGAFEEIGVGEGLADEEYFVSDYDTDLPGFDGDEHPDWDELFELAESWSCFNETEKKVVGCYVENVDDDLDEAIETVQSADYEVYEDCLTLKDVARAMFSDDLILSDLPGGYEGLINWDLVVDRYVDDAYPLDSSTYVVFDR